VFCGGEDASACALQVRTRAIKLSYVSARGALEAAHVEQAASRTAAAPIVRRNEFLVSFT
jgi:hypothetical protein